MVRLIDAIVQNLKASTIAWRRSMHGADLNIPGAISWTTKFTIRLSRQRNATAEKEENEKFVKQRRCFKHVNAEYCMKSLKLMK